MTREQIIDSIRRETVNNRLACEKAYALATELNVPLQQIGALCNELEIKIASCQLGCF